MVVSGEIINTLNFPLWLRFPLNKLFHNQKIQYKHSNKKVHHLSCSHDCSKNKRSKRTNGIGDKKLTRCSSLFITT